MRKLKLSTVGIIAVSALCFGFQNFSPSDRGSDEVAAALGALTVQCAVLTYTGDALSLTNSSMAGCQAICSSLIPSHPNIGCFWGSDALNNFQANPQSSIQLAPKGFCILGKSTSFGFSAASRPDDFLSVGVGTRGECWGAYNTLKNDYPYGKWNDTKFGF